MERGGEGGEKKSVAFDSCVYCCVMEGINCRQQQKVQGDTERLEKERKRRGDRRHISSGSLLITTCRYVLNMLA